MSFPKSISIHEQGPREGFQIEPGPIPTARKVELIDCLSETGLRMIQIASFAHPKLVPGWADAEAVVAAISPRSGVSYTASTLNLKALQRAKDTGRISFQGTLATSASEAFMLRNQNQDFQKNKAMMAAAARFYRAEGVSSAYAAVMATFGCNFAGEIAAAEVLAAIRRVDEVASEEDIAVTGIALVDTMAWANPESIKRMIDAVRSHWPDRTISLHLHDTRGLAVANAYAGLQMGVAKFDAGVGGLGGCPFGGHAGAAGNIATEDLVFLCEELGIETGVDLDKIIAAAKLAQEIVGHPLPGSVMQGGSLAGC